MILKDDAQKLLGIKVLFSLQVLVGAIGATNFGVIILKYDFENQMGIQILSRPISRTCIIWSKILLVIMYILIMGIVTCLLSLFTLMVLYYQNNMTSVVILGSFTGTLTVMLVFSSLTILVGLFVNKVGTFGIVVALEAILLVINVVFTLVSKNQIALKDEMNMLMKPVGLVLKNQTNNSKMDSYSTKWGATLQETGNKAITLNTRYKGLTLKQWGFPDLDSFSNYVMQNIYKMQDSSTINALDFQNQLASLYTFYSRKYVENMNSANFMEYMMWELNFTNQWIIEVPKVGFENINKNNNLIKYTIKNNSMYLIENPNIYFNSDKRGKIGVSSSLEVVDDDFKFPIENLKNKTKIYDFKNLSLFGYYFYRLTSVLNKKYDDLISHGTSSRYHSDSSIGYILTNFINYVYNGQDLTQMSDAEIYNKFNDFAYWVKKFQINTLKLFDDIYNHYSKVKYPWLNLKSFNNLLKVLSINFTYFTNPNDNKRIDFKKEFPVFVGGYNKFNNYYKKMLNNNLKSNELDSYIYKTRMPYSFAPENYLLTFNEVKLKPTYDFESMLAAWITLSVVLFGLSALVFTRKDFK